MTDIVEAFWENGELGPLGPTSYRAGYRLRMAGSIICNVELPAEIVEAAILARSALAMTVTPDGHVRSSLSGGTGSPSRAEPIDQLIAQLLSVENLRLEEISTADLTSLLERLERSAELVRRVMTHGSN
jgi:hypothetical protein